MDISGVGLQIQLIASVTYPAIGVNITDFADDSDPLDFPSLQLADKAMGLNGDLVSWGTANAIPMTVNVIPGSDSDIALSILAEANRVGRGKKSAKDRITAVVMYPDGLPVTLTGGVLTDAMPANSVASAGRKKSKPYIFAFENKVGI